MEYIYDITLDLNLDREMPVARVKQGDSSTRYLTVHLESDGEPYVPESGVEFLFRCEKPDGHGVMLDSEYKDSEQDRYLVINNGNGTISVELTSQCTIVPGVCKCDICMYRDNKILSTVPFAIDVKRSPNVASLIVSSDDFRTLVAAVHQARTIMAGQAQTTANLILPAVWNGTESPYTQEVMVTGYTVSVNTKVDLLADASTIDVMLEDRVNELMIINDGGTLTAYAIGNAPTQPLYVQACIYETLPI